MYFKRDYGLTEEQKDLQAMVHEFAEKEIKPRAAEWDVFLRWQKKWDFI